MKAAIAVTCTKHRHALFRMVIAGHVVHDDNISRPWRQRTPAMAAAGQLTGQAFTPAQSRALGDLLRAHLIRVSAATPRTGATKGLRAVFPTVAGWRWFETGPRARRGCTNGNRRGSSADRRRRKQWLLDEYGDGTIARCWLRGPACEIDVTLETISVERVIPGCRGGTYRRDNIRPACPPCQSRQGGQMGIEQARHHEAGRRDRAAQHA